jgi:hypothetical protein
VFIDLIEIADSLHGGAGKRRQTKEKKGDKAATKYRHGILTSLSNQEVSLLSGISIFNFGTAHSICLSASECKRPVGF